MKHPTKYSAKQIKRKARLTLVGCLLALLLSVAAAFWVVSLRHPTATAMATTTISNGRAEMPAVIGLPTGKDWPLVVLCHGFTGSNSGDGHFESLQSQLAAAGIASIAPDFPGCGQSSEPQTEYTLHNMMSDIDAAIDYMSAEYSIDLSRVALVGHSMGGRLVSLYLTEGSHPIKAAALWSPANGYGLQGLEFLDIDDFAHVEAIAAEARQNGSAPAGKFDFTLSAAFVDEMSASDPNAALAAAGIPLLLTYAGHEDLFSPETVDYTIQTVENLASTTVLLAPFTEAGHNYTAYGAETDAALNAPLDQALCDATADFLKKNL